MPTTKRKRPRKAAPTTAVVVVGLSHDKESVCEFWHTPISFDAVGLCLRLAADSGLFKALDSEDLLLPDLEKKFKALAKEIASL